MRLIDADALVASVMENTKNIDETNKTEALVKRLCFVLCDSIKRVPTAKPRWIPSAKRLPETSDKVLCCTATKKGQKNIVIGYYIADKEYWACGMNSNVIAWMPLPDVFVEET